MPENTRRTRPVTLDAKTWDAIEKEMTTTRRKMTAEVEVLVLEGLEARKKAGKNG